MRRGGILGGGLAIVAALIGGAGCGQKKAVECQGLVQVINGGVQSLEKQDKFEGDASGIAALKAMADVLDKLAADASKVQLTAPELQGYAGEYQAMAREVSRSAREMAAAAEAKDEKKLGAAQAAMEKAVKQEDPLIDNINKFCRSP
jgi:hypothetical protein